MYEENFHQLMHSNDLKEKIQIEDQLYLLILVTHLEDKGLVFLKKYNGGSFHIRLTPEGFQLLKDPINDDSTIMSNAYQLLFSLENYMRTYIKDKLINNYQS